MPTNPSTFRAPTRATEIASYALAGAALVAVLWLHLLPALFAGLLVYELVQTISPRLGRGISDDRARMLVVALLGAVVVGLLILLTLGTISFVRHEVGNPDEL